MALVTYLADGGEAMSMQVKRPECRQTVEVPAEAVGGHVPCAGYGTSIRVIATNPGASTTHMGVASPTSPSK